MTTLTPIQALHALVIALRDAGRAPQPHPRPSECGSYRCDVERPLLRAYDDALTLVTEHERKLVGDALAAWGSAVKWFVYGCVAPSGAVDCHGAYMNIDGEDDVCSFCLGPMGVPPRERARLRTSDDRNRPTVTAAEFDRDPKAVYDASQKAPVTVLDSRGRPSMTVCAPSAAVSSPPVVSTKTPRSDPKRLTKTDLAMLGRLANGRVKYLFAGVVFTQNRLADKGLARLVDDAGKLPKYRSMADWCEITDAGREALRMANSLPKEKK